MTTHKRHYFFTGRSTQTLRNNWINGNLNEVIDILENEHPAITAELLQVMPKDDVLRITRMLNARRTIAMSLAELE